MRLASLVGLALLTLAGCGSSHPVPEGAAQTALRAAVASYTSHLLDGDGDAAFSQLSGRCQTRIGHDTYVQEAQTIGTLYQGLTLTSYKVDSYNPPVARVTYSAGPTVTDETNQPWRYENDAWRWDAC